MNWKGLIAGIALIVVVGLAGFIYRNALEHPAAPGGAVACTAEAKVCPDGESVGRVAPSCEFAACPAPNVDLTSVGIAFALPAGYASSTLPDAASIAAYAAPINASTTDESTIVIRDYSIPAGQTAEDVIYANAVGDASGAPVSPAAFTSVSENGYTFAYVVLGRFEGVVHAAYYLSRQNDVLRFDATDRDVTDWTDSNLDVTTLPANAALRQLLSTLQND